jgi:hypothetical protein
MRKGRAAAIVFVLGACGYDWTVIPKTTPGGDDGGTPADAGDAGGVEAGDDGGAPCRRDDDCTKTQYCLFPDHLCGKGGSGHCVEIPLATTCDGEDVEITCLCSDDVVKSPCRGAAEGIDVSNNAVCPYSVSTPSYRCGFLYCTNDEFCLELDSPLDQQGEGVDYRCVPWTCPERTCACPDPTKKCPGATCEPLDGGTLVRCAGP